MTRQQTGLSILGIAGLLAAVAAGQTSEPKPRPLLVGVVDLGVVFTRYARTADVAREIDRQKEQLAARANEQEKKIESLRHDVDAAPEGTTAWRQKADELKLEQKALEAMHAESETIVKERFETLTLQEIDEIDAAVHRYAQANHFDVILKTTTKGWGETKLPERLYRAQISTVVAYDPSLDVTEAVLAELHVSPEKKKNVHVH